MDVLIDDVGFFRIPSGVVCKGGVCVIGEFGFTRGVWLIGGFDELGGLSILGRLVVLFGLGEFGWLYVLLGRVGVFFLSRESI